LSKTRKPLNVIHGNVRFTKFNKDRGNPAPFSNCFYNTTASATPPITGAWTAYSGATGTASTTSTGGSPFTVDSSGDVVANGMASIGTSNTTEASIINGGTLSNIAPYSSFYNGLTNSGTLVDIGASNTSTSAFYVGLNLENSSQTNNTYSPFITFSRKSDSGSFNMPYAAIGAQRTGSFDGSAWNAGDLVFSTNPLTSTGVTEKMRIMSSGNVGMGVPSPLARLHLLSATSDTAPDLMFTYDNSGDYRNGIANTFAGGTPSGNHMDFLLSNGTTTGQVNVMLLRGDGNVGIGNTGPGYPLDVTGDIRTSTCLHYASSTLGTCSSDAAIKRDVAPYVLGLDAVAGLKPVTYAYNGLGGNPDDGKRMVGLIAQDVEKVVPQLVGTRAVKLHPGDKTDTEIRTVDYGSLTYLLINAVKELKSLFDSDHDDIAKLKADNDNEAAQIKALTARLDAIEAAGR
jgi:hypothetical protein